MEKGSELPTAELIEDLKREKALALRKELKSSEEFNKKIEVMLNFECLAL